MRIGWSIVTLLTIKDYQKVTMAISNLSFNRRAIPADAQETEWAAPDGWKLRRIDWVKAQPSRGALLFLPGRGDHYEKYLETLAQLSDAGWAVTAIDWRGQGGSGRLLDDRHIGHIDDFATWIADLKAFWADWKRENQGPHVVLAHSMGGHLAMRALVEQAMDPDAVALSAPMLGIPTMGLPYAVHHAAARLLGKLGDPARAAWKEGEKPGSPLNVREKILTHDDDRYADELFWWSARPEVKLGPPSWHWVERAIASTRLMNKAGVLEAVHVPILLMATTADKLVDTKRIIRDAKRLPQSELLLFGAEAAHELLREADPVRDRCMAAISGFFDKVANPA
jgi:lysophospholipase